MALGHEMNIRHNRDWDVLTAKNLNSSEFENQSYQLRKKHADEAFALSEEKERVVCKEIHLGCPLERVTTKNIQFRELDRPATKPKRRS